MQTVYPSRYHAGSVRTQWNESLVRNSWPNQKFVVYLQYANSSVMFIHVLYWHLRTSVHSLKVEVKFSCFIFVSMVIFFPGRKETKHDFREGNQQKPTNPSHLVTGGLVPPPSFDGYRWKTSWLRPMAITRKWHPDRPCNRLKKEEPPAKMQSALCADHVTCTVHPLVPEEDILQFTIPTPPVVPPQKV